MLNLSMEEPWMRNAGYSLLEALVALALVIGGSYFIKDQFLASISLQDIIKDRNYLQTLEDDLRTSILDDRSFSSNIKNDPSLKTCAEKDNVNCPKTKPSVNLISSRGKPVTGGFAGPAKSCKGDACPVQIKAFVGASCPYVEGEEIADECDVAGSLRIEYQISVDGSLYRQGFVQKMMGTLSMSDENSSCPTDSYSRTEFARVVAHGHVVCLRLERPQLKLRGLYAGFCDPGLELLRGFSKGGHPICAPIKWE